MQLTADKHKYIKRKPEVENSEKFHTFMINNNTKRKECDGYTQYYSITTQEKQLFYKNNNLGIHYKCNIKYIDYKTIYGDCGSIALYYGVELWTILRLRLHFCLLLMITTENILFYIL